MKMIPLWTTALLLSASASAANITLTGFEPFGGVKINNSAAVAKRLAALLTGLRGDQNQVQVCILPVEYDRAADVAFKCIGDRKPDLVLSFGTGGCEIDFETRATNRDYARVPDNAGVLRNVGTPVVKGGPRHFSFSAPMWKLYRESRQTGKVRLLPSWDAGSYVCNNTAYFLSRIYSVKAAGTKYGFIHVPPITCGAEVSSPDLIAATIYEGLRGAMPELF